MRDYNEIQNYFEATKAFQLDWIANKLRQYQGNVAHTARMTGLSRQMLHLIIKLHNL